ncbi:alpha- and gamma-adaptin-binding protein p34-like isoform X2 [Diorhabda carinulata]|uniref:alpha- and gamma-adaptin-binding protein p34-like isoform X2 n=1 Tax=Diorhabda carinulata TaxID=1163345 RepID=UPI00259FE753|nr:alpha- and gamma-adaptin-binding protein p34-like isoform X2 [Diorhabda carinulata]
METLPGIAVVSSSQTRPKSLIKLITKLQIISETSDKPGVTKHCWNIDTKYYTARVNFLEIETTDAEKDEDLIKSIEALIIHMDSNSETGLDDLKKWKFLDVWNADVKLLLANYCTENTKITKTQALEWCLKMGFEFIELYPTVLKQDEDEIITEKFGVERVVEALHSHTWSNLVMKDKKNIKPVKCSDTKKDNGDGNEEILPNDELDDFADLFSQLQTMKDSLQGMPVNQRKQCAEQMVTAFWKAIGGEEEEIFD